MQQQPPAPKVPLEESVAGEEDPGASLDAADMPVTPPAPPPAITPPQNEKPGGG